MATTEKNYLVVACEQCEADVRAEVVGAHEVKFFSEDFNAEFPHHLFSLAVCPSCEGVLMARQNFQMEGSPDEGYWMKPVRVWPRQERESTDKFPDIVRVSLDEAHRCHRASAFTASAVMAGRSLEGICLHFRTKDKTLSKGLKELLDKEVIDQRLFQWGEELRKLRNLAAHASAEKVSREDATDLLDFLNAICEYVFVLTPKFQSFMKRKAAPKAPMTGDSDGGKPKEA
ncbi:MAG: DUF4145 domain-containing protein [Polyangiaceae bacterium]